MTQKNLLMFADVDDDNLNTQTCQALQIQQLLEAEDLLRVEVIFEQRLQSLIQKTYNESRLAVSLYSVGLGV